MTVANDMVIRRGLEAAGVEFIDGNGGGPGVRLRKRRRAGRWPRRCFAQAPASFRTS
jgi:hypothetical protein